MHGFCADETLLGGGWMEPLGNLAPPALGASTYEEALRGSGYGSLRLVSDGGERWEQGGVEWARSTQSDMELRVLLTAPMNTLVGLSLDSPWPVREVLGASDTLYLEQESTNFTLLLGMRPFAPFLVYGEIPIANGTGIWRAGAEITPLSGARLRLRYAQKKTSENLLNWKDSLVAGASHTERQGEAALALALPLNLQAGASLRYSDFEGNFAGHAWAASGELLYVKPAWSLKTQATATWRALQYASTSAGAANASYDAYRWSTRLQRTFLSLFRVGLEARQDLLKQNANAAWLEQKSYGGDARIWWRGLYFQAGGLFVGSQGKGSTLEPLGMGRKIPLRELFAKLSFNMRIEAGFEMAGTTYRYAYSQWFALQGAPTVKRVGTHTFEIAGGF